MHTAVTSTEDYSIATCYEVIKLSMYMYTHTYIHVPCTSSRNIRIGLQNVHEERMYSNT